MILQTPDNTSNHDNSEVDEGVFEPYNHQVGGHCCILKFAGKICKPLIMKEYDFYRIIHKYPQLLSLIPEFFGYIIAPSSIPAEDSPSLPRKISARHKGYLISDRDVVPRNTDLNQCYIVLQDLTAGMTKPCVMDMKMGTHRQRFDTSVMLGHRLCGMRVWRGDELYSVDRLFGRGLTTETVEDAISAFFFNGRLMLTQLIPPLIQKLRAMIDTVSNFPFRFYTSSLLFIYDGGNDYDYFNPSGGGIDVRIVDFAHANYKETADGEPDDGFIFGLRNLVTLFERILERYAYSDSQSSGSEECDSDVDSMDTGRSSSSLPDEDMDSSSLSLDTDDGGHNNNSNNKNSNNNRPAAASVALHKRCAPFPLTSPTSLDGIPNSVGY